MPPVRPPRPVLVALGVLVAVWAAFLVGTFLRSTTDVVWDAWIYDGLTAGCALVVVARVVVVRTERGAWSCVAAGLLANTCGDVTWSVLSATGDPPFPNASDGLYLMLYPCLYLALVLLLRGRLRRFGISAWLDGLVTALALTAVVAAVAFDRITAGTGGGALAVAAALAYPVGDLVLLAMVAGALALIGWRADVRWWSLSAGFALYAVVDTTFLFQAAAGTYRDGTWIDALWPASGLLIAVTSWRPSRQLRFEGPVGWGSLLPSLAGTAGAVVVLWAAAGPAVTRLAVTLAAATLLAAATRFALGFREVTAVAESRQQALTDELTGLANRRALLRALAELPADAGPGAVALMLVDLDRFKEVNDSLGHHVGDELLVQVGRRIADAAPAGALVARVGGDEFAVLLRPEVTTPGRGRRPAPGGRGGRADDAEAVGERVVAALEAPFALDDVTLHVHGSIGIGRMPEHTTSRDQLLQRADVAMYTAKGAAKRGDGRVAVYRAEDDPHSRQRLELLEELRHALRSGRVVCHFQPLVDLTTGRTDSVEALARWDHPTRGLVPPEQFLPLAEQAGLMREITEAVLHHALGQVRRWRDLGLDVGVAVNLSPTNLLDVDLPHQIAAALQLHGLPGSSLRVEITETVLMTSFTRSCQTLERLHAVGVEASIDDYGTGYSSLAYLQDLPVAELKLDRAFISRFTTDARTAAIVRSTIDLAHSLGLRMVAEGVQDERTAEDLRFLGCDLAQGFHFCRPLRGDVMTRWLTEFGGQVADRTRLTAGTGGVPGVPAQGRPASQFAGGGR